MTYDPGAVASHFDDFSDREWQRLDATVQGRIKHAIHKRFIEQHIRPGMHVLDVGSGPGRFALDVAELGADVTLVDISQVQLDLAREQLARRGALERVNAFRRLDVVDLSSLTPASYDAVVCFGGAVSYTRERYLDALRQLVNIVRPGSPILLSVMSLFGALRLVGPLDAASFLESIDDHLDRNAVFAGAGVVCTRSTSKEFHQPLALFTSAGLRSALVEVGLDVEVIASASPFVPEFLSVPKISVSTRASEVLTALEDAFCDHPGLVDAGGHLLAVARKPIATGTDSVSTLL